MIWDTIWQYAVLFLMAAAPWLEVFLVVPLGIAWGLNPAAVAVTGFVGNWIPVLLIAYFFKQITAWRKRRKLKKLQSQQQPESAAAEAAAAYDPTSKRQRRARTIWEKYGVPGLALVAPAFVGTDIAALLALAFGSSRNSVIVWITISLALWTIALAIGSVYGLSYMQWLKP